MVKSKKFKIKNQDGRGMPTHILKLIKIKGKFEEIESLIIN